MNITTTSLVRIVIGFSVVALSAMATGCGSSGSGEPENTAQAAEANYRLTTEFLGQSKLLSVSESTDGSYEFGFEESDSQNSNQLWFIDLSQGDATYRITNSGIGRSFSLDVVNDGVLDKLNLAPSSDANGQQWQITKLENGYCRLTNNFTGSEIALDVVSDAADPTITLRSVENVSGQHWNLEERGTTSGALGSLCHNR